MALTITVAELAAAIRVTADATAAPSEPQLAILHRQLRTAEAEIEGYAPDAPDDTKDEAAIRMVGYLYDAQAASRTQQNAFLLCGARALLARWHVLVSSLVGAGTPAAIVAPETGLNPSHPVHPGTHYRYMGWIDSAAVAQAALDAAARFTSDVLTVPNRATAGYIFFGVESNPGYPDSALLDGNPTNQITNFIQQAGTLTRDGETVVIGVSTAEQTPLLSGRMWDVGVQPVMPVDFSDFIRSTRSDGKLIISNAIRAVFGTKLVTDARGFPPTALEFDLEDGGRGNHNRIDPEGVCGRCHGPRCRCYCPGRHRRP